jgi:hypothetical protein
MQKKKDYTRHIKSYRNVKKIFIGRGSDGDNIGNSILVNVTGNKYVCIGTTVYEFTILDDKIKRFYSMVSRGDTPNPMIVGEKNVYFLNYYDRIFLSRDYFKDFPKKYSWDSYEPHDIVWVLKNKKRKKLRKLSNIKVLHTRR